MAIYKDAIGAKLDLSRDINAAAADIKSLSALRNTLHAYGRTKDVYKQFRNLNEKKRPTFYNEHKADIDTHRAAKKALSEVKPPVPTAKAVTAEIDRLKASKADTYAQYKQNEAKLKELDVIRQNLDSIIRQHEPKHQKNHDLSIYGADYDSYR